MTKEQERYNLQRLLDSQKSDKERNRLGQFSTPYLLAKDMVDHVLSIRNNRRSIRFLEPSIGTGVFYSALLDSINPVRSMGFEIDEHYYRPSCELWDGYNINIVHGDFFNFTPSPEFNLILANPPYSRHHHIDGETKKKLQSLIRQEYGIQVSGLAGLYCYFLILSTLWLEEGGISSWLIPSEFLDVNYGISIKEFLCSKVELISIHKFNPEDLQFADALVSSSIVTFRKSVPKGNPIKFTTGPHLNAPATIAEVSWNNLVPYHKWSPFFESAGNIRSEKGKCLGEYFKVSRGISTGNNSFFILRKDVAFRKGLPLEYLIPILPAPRNLHAERVEANFKGLGEDDRYFLLSCPLPIDIIEIKYPQLFDYIKDGEQRGINSSYNCQRRFPWYLCEMRSPAPIYMTYMGRGIDNNRMFRFILNESSSVVTNSYLMLYPRDGYKYCFDNKKTAETVWTILNGISKERLVRCGRSYGGGLFKIEPKELEALIIPELDSILSPQQPSLFEF